MDDLFALEMEEEFLEVFDTDDLDVREKRGLREVFEGNINFRDIGGASGFDDVDDAMDGTERTIEGKLADEETIFKR